MEKQELYLRNFSNMLKIATVSSTEGDTDTAAFDEFHALLPKIFPHLFAAAEVEYFHGSLLLRWPGKSRENPFLLMNHHDVVSAGPGWEHPPFCGEVFDGKLWGRGALDTKGGLWAMLQAAEDLCAEGFTPPRDIYFESSCFEEINVDEGGAEEIAGILLERGLRFSLVLDEGGMVVYDPIGGTKGWFAMVGMGERGCVVLRFSAKGTGAGHASTPARNSPLVQIGRFIKAAEEGHLFKVTVTPQIQEMFRRMAPTVSGGLKFVYGHPVLFTPLLKILMPRLSPTSRALVQTTLAFTMASGSERPNVMPAVASVTVNMRVAPNESVEENIAKVTALAKKYGLEAEILEPGNTSPLSDHRSDAFALVDSAVSAVFPGVITAPYIMTGASDAQHMGKLSSNIMHFTPFKIDGQQMCSIHGPNENVDVSALVPAVDFYKYLMKGMNDCVGAIKEKK